MKGNTMKRALAILVAALTMGTFSARADNDVFYKINLDMQRQDRPWTVDGKEGDTFTIRAYTKQGGTTYKPTNSSTWVFGWASNVNATSAMLTTGGVNYASGYVFFDLPATSTATNGDFWAGITRIDSAAKEHTWPMGRLILTNNPFSTGAALAEMSVLMNHSNITLYRGTDTHGALLAGSNITFRGSGSKGQFAIDASAAGPSASTVTNISANATNDANLMRFNVAGTIAVDMINTASPWAENEIVSTMATDAELATAANAGTNYAISVTNAIWADAQVANALTVDDAGIASTIARDSELVSATNSTWGVHQYPAALLTNGTRAMGGVLDMGGFSITNIATNSLTFATGETITAPKVNTWDGHTALITANTTLANTIDSHNDAQDLNIAANTMRTAVNGALGQVSMTTGHIDQYEDQTGIDAATSTNENYAAAANAYYAAYDNSDLLAGLVVQYKVNDNAASSTVLDSSGNGLDGTLKDNGVAINTDTISAAGKINETLDFLRDSANDGDYIETPTSFSTAVQNGAFSILTWVSYDSGIYICGVYDSTPSLDRLHLQVGASQILSCAITVDGTATTFDTAASIVPVGSWMHVALVVSGNDAAIYTNGAACAWLTDPGSIGGTLANFSPDFNMQIGAINVNGTPQSVMDGRVDDFRFYSVALSQSQINAIYSGGSGTESTNSVISGGNMLLQSVVHTTSVDYVEATLMGYWDETNGVVLNTDLKGHISNDGGATWQRVTLARDPNGAGIDANTVLISGVTNFATGATSNHVAYKWDTFNNINYTNRGTAVLYK